ncbi:hypothetical protein [Streptomyces broussonetiae]|uniref:PPE domain-containing protein n=1 Tax=Streptomyces broussonetiae TaxID=2686304 RepID=A0ABV5EKZ1_9ACTN
MSGDGDKNTQERHQEEYQEAQNQNGTLDAVMNMTRLFSPFGSTRGIHFGSTNFEGYDLNDMIDIVESANPELLETAGTALVDARDAIKEAADELAQNLGRIDWEGEAHTAFADWGDSLIKTAQGIADYADVIGTQVIAAGSGLASVRKSMPPRDTRTDRKSVDDIPEAKRVDSNEDYTAALKAEAHRQEAINQMYRLASFYTVSAGAMGAAEEPVFPKMPDVGVPEPTAGISPQPPERQASRSLPAIGDSQTVSAQAVGATSERSQPNTALPPVSEATDSAARGDRAERPVGTEINTVGVLPSETTKPAPTAPPSQTGPASTPTGPVPPMAPGATSPVVGRGGGRPSGLGNVPGPKGTGPAQGRVGGMPGGTQPGRAGAGPLGPVGRAAGPGQTRAGGVGPAGRTGTGPMGPVGRPVGPGQAATRGIGPAGRGVIGGVPRAGGPTAGPGGFAPRGPVGGAGPTNPARPAAGRTGTGRSGDGVVGGRPVSGTTRGTSGPGGSRLPRGTVIGGEGTAASRSSAQRPGQRGVVGVPPGPPTGAGGIARRPGVGSDGVVGMPKGRPETARKSGSTPDAPGARRGPENRQGSGGARSRRDERRDEASATD